MHPSRSNSSDMAHPHSSGYTVLRCTKESTSECTCVYMFIASHGACGGERPKPFQAGTSLGTPANRASSPGHTSAKTEAVGRTSSDESLGVWTASLDSS